MTLDSRSRMRAKPREMSSARSCRAAFVCCSSCTHVLRSKYAIERLQIIETLRVHYSWFSRCEGVHNPRMVGGPAALQEAVPLTKARAPASACGAAAACQSISNCRRLGALGLVALLAGCSGDVGHGTAIGAAAGFVASLF
jgi:hypothetical protein